MAKRKVIAGSEEEEAAEAAPSGSAADRRRERKRDRAAREAGNRKAGRRGWSRTALAIGVPVAALIVIIVILLVNPFSPPCLQLQNIPSSSGTYPEFPAHNSTTDLSTSWCPPDVSSVLAVFPQLRIDIQGTQVPLPTSIGSNSSYTYSGTTYTCALPIRTEPTATGGLTPETIYIISPWNYIYTLGQFFNVWAESYKSADINASYAAQPIVYSSGDLLGFSTDSSHAITLFVDNQVSYAGPNLNLDTLSGSSGVYPGCFATLYGTSHTILLADTPPAKSGAGRGLTTPVLATAAGPSAAPWMYDSPGPHLVTYLAELQITGPVGVKSLGWLLLRPSP